MLQTDIRILDLEPIFEREKLRTPLKFGTGQVTECTSVKVRARVENRAGAVAEGWGQILLGVLWAFPSTQISYWRRDEAMRRLCSLICRALGDVSGFHHPLDLYLAFEPELGNLSQQTEHEMSLGVSIPPLASLVCGSPADAALHDAFGVVNDVSSYKGCGPEFISHDLSTYLGQTFRDKFVTDYIRDHYRGTLPIFHLVGGADKLRENALDDADPQDGLPVSLEAWIERDGVYCFKVKLRGTDVDWDVNRTVEVAEVARETLARRGREQFFLSTDANELCPDAETVVKYLMKLREASPMAFEHLLYVEQPTERDLSAHRFDMESVAAIKPVVADEGITDLRSLELARELGWSGVALKTCKGHSEALLYVALASESDLVYTVQDLTNPGLAFLHSAGLAARTSPLMGVEHNARQYLPRADQRVQEAHPTVFQVLDGCISTRALSEKGLGYHGTLR